AGQVDGDDAVPLALVDVADVAHLARVAGIVDEDVHASEALEDPARQLRRLPGAADVRRARRAAAAAPLDLGDDLVEGRLPAPRHHDLRAFLREHPRRRAADAGAAAGDERHLPAEPHPTRLPRGLIASREYIIGGRRGRQRQAHTGCSRWSTRVGRPWTT